MNSTAAPVADPDLTPHPDELENRQRISKLEAGREAAQLYRSQRDAALSTASNRLDGWPFGSIAPYAPDARGWPLIYVAEISEHGRNIRRDPRCSLLVRAPSQEGVDAQTAGRLTVLGAAQEVPEGDWDDAFARYVARVPGARTYGRTHAFRLLRIQPERLRYIGGFGKIFWLDRSTLEIDPDSDPLEAARAAIVGHMNDDHADALALCCEAFYGISPAVVCMTGVDRFGFDVTTEDPTARLRFDFESEVGPETVRSAVVDLVAKARARLGL